MIIESLIMDLMDVNSNCCTLLFVVENGEEKSSIEKVLHDMGWIHFNRIKNPNLYVKENKRVMFIEPVFYSNERFCGVQVYGVVITHSSFQHLDLTDLMWLRTRVRNYGQYSSTHIAFNYKGYWEVEGF